MKPNRIKELRTRRGLTQVQLAEMAWCSSQVLSDYEAYRVMPAGDTAVRISAALGVSTAYLLCLSDDPERAKNLPPEWEQVVSEAMADGFTPEQIEAALQMLRTALGKGRPGT